MGAGVYCEDLGAKIDHVAPGPHCICSLFAVYVMSVISFRHRYVLSTHCVAYHHHIMAPYNFINRIHVRWYVKAKQYDVLFRFHWYIQKKLTNTCHGYLYLSSTRCGMRYVQFDIACKCLRLWEITAVEECQNDMQWYVFFSGKPGNCFKDRVVLV